MAKPFKVDDYWRHHNIENLFKELTQTLVRRMPSDPVIAIVEHLQKKFPKSFKTSADNIGVVPKPLANSLQLNSITSPRSDTQNESINDMQIGRRSSNQSLLSGNGTIPTMGSAFTDLLKQDTTSARQAPEMNIKNLVFANRLTQQTVRMGKDIRSDRDILEEEVIKPMKTKETTSTTTDLSTNSVPAEDNHDPQTHDQPSVRQIIKYKQNIRTENDRRLHRENLAQLAKQQREKEHLFQSDLSTRPEDLQQQQKADGDEESQAAPLETSQRKVSHKPIAKSKEEEEILNDENVFQPRMQRDRGRQRNKTSRSRSNTPYLRGRQTIDPRSTTRRNDGSLTCKVCGNVINRDENEPPEEYQKSSAALSARPYDPQQSVRSVETSSAAVDDWFESASNASGSRLSPWTPDDALTLPIGSSTFRRNLFQPIKDNQTDTVQHQSPVRSSLVTDDATKSNRLTSPRMSESGIFARSPDPKVRRPPSSRSIPSPVTKKHQPDPVAITGQQLTKTLTQPSPPRSRPPSTLGTTMPGMNDRRMSGWSVREHSPDGSDEN